MNTLHVKRSNKVVLHEILHHLLLKGLHPVVLNRRPAVPAPEVGPRLHSIMEAMGLAKGEPMARSRKAVVLSCTLALWV